MLFVRIFCFAPAALNTEMEARRLSVAARASVSGC